MGDVRTSRVTLTKTVDEVLVREFELKDQGLAPGETIDSSLDSYAIEPSGELAVSGTPSVVGTVAIFKLMGGVAGRTYKVWGRAVTSQNQKIEFAGWMKVGTR